MNPPRPRPDLGIVYLCAAATFVVAFAVLIGWSADIGVLKTVLPGYPEMKPVGAGGFMLLAFGLVLSVQDENDRRFRWATGVIGGIVAAAASILLLKYLLHISNNIAAVLVPDLGPTPGSPGSKISPISAISFIFLAVSIALVRSRRFKQLSGVLVVLALTATYAAILGHLYHADTFYGFSGINGMPLHTAFLFVVIGAGLLLRNRDFHLIKLIGSDSPGGTVARRLIPFVVLIPTCIGWLRVFAQDRGLYDTGFGSALSTFILVILTLAIVLFFSSTVHRADRKRRLAEAELAEKEMRFRDLFDYSQGMICIHDLDGTLTTVNPAALASLGYTSAELVGRNLRDLLAKELRPGFDAYLREIENAGLAGGLLSLVSKDGRKLIWRYKNILASEPGKEPYVLGHAQDVTELIEAQKALKNLSLTDELTGLYNRRGFLTMAEQQIRLEMHSSTARGLVLMFADLDGLKKINDTYGHEMGSDAIVAFSQLVKSVMRSADLIARWGGDEFVILTIGSLDEHVDLMSSRIKQKLAEYNAAGSKPYRLSCSIGAAPVPTGTLELESIIAEADKAMYAEKYRQKEKAGLVFEVVS